MDNRTRDDRAASISHTGDHAHSPMPRDQEPRNYNIGDSYTPGPCGPLLHISGKFWAAPDTTRTRPRRQSESTKGSPTRAASAQI